MTEPAIAATYPNAIELEPGTYYWCACGQSKNGSFCDGSHKGSEFTPKAFEITEPRKVYICQCKRTQNAPFCDGTHKALKEQ